MMRCALLAVFVGACTGGSTGTTGGPTTTGSTLHACDPLSASAETTTLGTLIAAGRAPDGTVYVVDQIAGTYEPRVFVSHGNELQRETVNGTGELPNGTSDVWLLTIESNLQMRIELENHVAMRMGIFRGAPDPKTKSFEIGVQGDVLALLTPADLTTFSRILDISGTRLTWDGKSSDGHHLVLVESARDVGVYRVFYGIDPVLSERKVLDDSSDSRLRVGFDVDGNHMLAEIATALSATRESTLQKESPGGTTIVVATLIPVEGSNDFDVNQPLGVDSGAPIPPPPKKSDAELLAGLSFQCF